MNMKKFREEFKYCEICKKWFTNRGYKIHKCQLKKKRERNGRGAFKK